MTSLATVDAIHAPAIREALADAGIDAQLVEVQPFNQLAYLRHQRRPMVDVQVADGDAEAARGVLERVELAAAEALAAQAGGDPDATKSEDDLRLEAEEAARRAQAPPRRRSVWVGALLGLTLPVVGPVYAGGAPLVMVSLLVNLILVAIAVERGFPDRVTPVIGVLLGAFRILESVITARAIHQENAAAEEKG
jgi:hypothetical protein